MAPLFFKEIVMVTINGEKVNTSGCTISEMLVNQGYDSKKVVVEINLNIIPKENFDNTVIEENDSIEVLSFVGGG